MWVYAKGLKAPAIAMIQRLIDEHSYVRLPEDLAEALAYLREHMTKKPFFFVPIAHGVCKAVPDMMYKYACAPSFAACSP